MRMSEYRDEVMEARIKFLRAFDQYPQHLFASPQWALDVSLALANELGSPPQSIAGKGFYNMVIHVVPTLDGRFLVA